MTIILSILKNRNQTKRDEISPRKGIVMIEKFQAGKKYKWIGECNRPSGWNIDGEMDKILSGCEITCIFTESRYYGEAAEFDEIEKHGGGGWAFSRSDLNNFIEI